MSFNNRQMPPPPSSPQHYHARPTHYSQSGQPAPPPGRDLPPFHSIHRPGSGMSISSMLGGEPERRDPLRDSAPPHSSFPRPPVSSAAQPSNPGAMSPPRNVTRVSPSEHPPYGRSHTPDHGNFARLPGPRQYRASSGENGPMPSPFDQSRAESLPRPPPLSHRPDGPPYHQGPPMSSIGDSPHGQPRRLSSGSTIPRPNSQPQMEEGSRASLYSPEMRRPMLGDGPTRYSSGYRDYDGPDRSYGQDARMQEQMMREREQESSRRSFGADERKPQHSALWNSQPAPSRPLFGDSGRPYGAPAQDHAPMPYPGSRRDGPTPARSQPAPSVKTETSGMSDSSRRNFSPFSQPGSTQPPGPTSSSANVAAEEQRRKSDDMLQHRNLLQVANDIKRVGGRVSPLPQAVQGAQAQSITPDSGINRDLGRVFSGIGSGVGSANGTPLTPSVSPFKRDEAGSRVPAGDADAAPAKVPRASSGAGKRGRKIKEEDKGDGEVGEERSSSATGRGTKRARHVHHHHHHHHHHRPPRAEDDIVVARKGTPSGSSLPPAPAAPQSVIGDGVDGPHHHHHHHHHHAHAPASVRALTPPPPIKKPTKSLFLLPIIRTILDKPRRHLGSHLYAPNLSPPSIRATPESGKFGFVTTPNPLPRFSATEENCTLTVRVSRYFLDSVHREEIVARRALWGAGVFSDDSDPVAAAIHGGFVRGEWSEELLGLTGNTEGDEGTSLMDMDPPIMDVEIGDSVHDGTFSGTTNSISIARPPTPTVPPPDKDLHITLLMLPALDHYASMTLYGLRSREWGDSHDGMSFMVLGVEWVDEGGRGKVLERGGKARRRRLEYRGCLSQAPPSMSSGIAPEKNKVNGINGTGNGTGPAVSVA